MNTVKELTAVEELVMQEMGIEIDEVTEWVEDNVRVYEDCWTMEDVAREWIDSIGSVTDAVRDVTYYVDMDALVRLLDMDGCFDDEDGEDMYPDYADKEAYAQELIDDGCLTAEWLADYVFDYEAFGRDMEIEGSFYYMGKGTYIEIMA